MKSYEVTFIVDPVLSGDEIKSTAKTYEDLLKKSGYEIVHLDEMGLKQLAYPINKRNSGIYYCIEFSGETGDILAKMELALRRDERIMRFLTVKLDKYGVKYNDDKRQGKIGKVKKKEKVDKDRGRGRRGRHDSRPQKRRESEPAAPKAAPAAAPAATETATKTVAKSEEE